MLAPASPAGEHAQGAADAALGLADAALDLAQTPHGDRPRLRGALAHVAQALLSSAAGCALVGGRDEASVLGAILKATAGAPDAARVSDALQQMRGSAAVDALFFLARLVERERPSKSGDATRLLPGQSDARAASQSLGEAERSLLRDLLPVLRGVDGALVARDASGRFVADARLRSPALCAAAEEAAECGWLYARVAQGIQPGGGAVRGAFRAGVEGELREYLRLVASIEARVLADAARPGEPLSLRGVLVLLGDARVTLAFLEALVCREVPAGLGGGRLHAAVARHCADGDDGRVGAVARRLCAEMLRPIADEVLRFARTGAWEGADFFVGRDGESLVLVPEALPASLSPEDGALVLASGRARAFLSAAESRLGYSSLGTCGAASVSGDVLPHGTFGYVSQNGNAVYATNNGNSGYAAQNGTSGNLFPQGNSGYATQNGNSGYVFPHGNAGYAIQNGNAGYATQNGNSGYVFPHGNAGYVFPHGSAGYETNNGNAGYVSQNGNCGTITHTNDASPAEHVRAAIRAEHSLACAALRRVLFERLHVGAHVAALRDLLHFGRGDFAAALMDAVCGPLSRPAHTLHRHAVAGGLDAALRAVGLGGRAPGRPAWLRDVAERIDVRLHDVGGGAPSKLLGWDVFALDYRVDFPLSAVLSPGAVAEHVRVSHFLWSLRRVHHVLSGVWARLGCVGRLAASVPGLSAAVETDAARLRLFVAEGACLARQLVAHAHGAVGAAWASLDARLAAARDLCDYSAAHDAVVAEIRGRLPLFAVASTRGRLAAALSALLRAEGVVSALERYVSSAAHWAAAQGIVSAVPPGAADMCAPAAPAAPAAFASEQTRMLTDVRASFQAAVRAFHAETDALVLHVRREAGPGAETLLLLLDYGGYHARRGGFDARKYAPSAVRT